MTRTIRRIPLATAAGAIALSSVLTSCSDGRSVEAFCSTMDSYRENYLAAMGAATDQVGTGEAADVVSGLVGAAGAIGDIGQMWRELEEVAPSDIQPNLETISDSWDAQMDASGDVLSNPLAGLASSLVEGLTAAPAYARVDEWTIENCS